MLKAIVFDCDGVILESTDIKTEAFRALFEPDYPDQVDDILAYHVRNMGIPRQVKFRHICTEILGETCPAQRQARLAAQFSRLVFDRVLACPLVRGTRQFLRQQKGKRRLFVASGAPQAELRDILERRGLSGYFDGIFGFPAKKPDVIRRVLRQGPFCKTELAFVGDAPADYQAARQTGVHFIRRKGSPAEWKLAPCRWEIADLSGLSAVLKTIENVKS